MRKIESHKSLFILIPAVLIILFSMLLPGISNAGPLDTWTSKTTSPISSYYYYNIAYGEGVFIAVRSDNNLLKSTDYGTTWTQKSVASPSGYILRDVIYADGMFVAVGSSGTILLSEDGDTWTAVSGVTDHLYGVTYGNGYFVAVGSSGKIWTSGYNDPATWAARTSGTTYSFYDVAFGNGIFTAVGYYGTVRTSSDNGVTWTARTSNTTNTFESVTYGNGYFVAVGGVYNTASNITTSSDNGVTWTARSAGVNTYLRDITYGNGTFVAVGETGTILTSTNAITWTSKTSGTSNSIQGIAYGEKVYIAVGGYIFLTSGNIAATDAADTASFSFTTGGNAQWFGQNSVSYTGGDALQTGDIDDSQSTWLETTLTGPSSVSFWWKVSSDGPPYYVSPYDILHFYVDGVEQSYISGEVDWQQKFFDIASGSHTLKWTYTKDGVVSMGSDAGWLDKICYYSVYTGDYNLNTEGSQLFTSNSSSSSHITVETQSGCTWTAVSNDNWITIDSISNGVTYGTVYYIVSANLTGVSRTGTITVAGKTFTITQGSVVSLATALGNSSYTWTTGGNAVWAGQNAAPYNATNAAQSGDITDNQASYFQTTVTGPMTISYYWKVASEGTYDLLNFYDGLTSVYSTSGDYDWVQKTYSVPSGSHTLKWQYSKETDYSKRNDSGWVNRICTFSLPSSSSTFTSAATSNNSATVTVTGTSCSWTASTADSWITITSGTSGTGSGTVTYSLSANPDSTDRTGTITIAGQAFNITQKGVISTYAALDYGSSSTWTTGGDASWMGQSLNGTHDGTDSLQSGLITHDQTSWFQTSITETVPSSISFYWKVSSENSYDYLRFYIDGVEQAGSISGTVDWTLKTYGPQAAGTHTYKWAYTKDGSVNSGSDAGWIDQVCTFKLSPTAQSQTHSEYGYGTGSFTVTTQSGCEWTASVTNGGSWLSVTNGTGSGTTTINYSYGDNATLGTQSRTGTISVNGLSFSVTQAGNSPSVGVDYASQIDFGALNTSTISTKTLTFSNIGSGTLTFTSKVVTAGANTNAGEFSITNDTCNVSLNAGNSCTVEITFDAAPSSGSKTATLAITTNDPASPKNITLNGSLDETAPATTASVPQGLYSAAQSVMLTCIDNAGGSGCASTYYCLGASNCTPETAYAGEIPVGSSNTLRFYSKDGVNNSETIQSISYNIDSTPAVSGDIQTFIALPKTGQTTCYDNQATPAATDCTGPGGIGQDGMYASLHQNGKTWPVPRFEITYRNSSGPCTDQSADCDANTANDVVIDRLTGLMWPRKADSPTVLGSGTCNGGMMSWTNAISTYIDCLNSEHYLGFTDWRMPNRNEMASLINIEASNPATWLNTQAFTGFASNSYWTSTADAASSGNAWIATLSTGKVVSDGKGVSYYVHPVRDSLTESTVLLSKTGQTASSTTNDDGDLELGEAWPSPRFKDNGNGTVLDNLTGVIWLEDGSTPTDGACTGGVKNWQDALTYVACLNANSYKGFNDWRLPNRNELSSLFNASQSSNATWLNNNEFRNFPTDSNYWTSSTSANTTTKAWFVRLDSGMIDHNTKTSQTYYVLPVRSGKLASALSGAGIYLGFGEASTKSSKVVVTLSASDANAITAMKLSNDNINWTEMVYATNKTWTLSSGDGEKTVYVKFEDIAGNWSTATISDTITLDTVAPTTTASPAGGIVGVGQVVTLTANEAGSTIYYTTNSVDPTPSLTGYSTPKTVTISANTTLKFLAVDSLGNAESFKTESYTIDNTAPSTTASPVAGSYKGTQSVTLTCTDSGSGCANIYYTTDGTTPTAGSSVFSSASPIQISTNGTLKYFAVDNAGVTETPVKESAYTIDTGVPTVAITAPSDGSMLSSMNQITGTASDAASGISKVEVSIYDGTYYVNSSNEFVVSSNPIWRLATGTTSWSNNISAINFVDNTTYTITAKATDAATNESTYATSTFTKVSSLKLSTVLSLDLSSQTVLKDATVTATGKLTRNPDIGAGLKGLAITIKITAPNGSISNLPTTTYDSYGHYKYENISGFNQKGSYSIQASFDGTALLDKADSYSKSVLVGASAGYAILVQGKIPNEEGILSHNKTAGRIYKKLKDRGFTDDNINYFNYNTGQTGVDAAPSKAAIQAAVDTWAKGKMNDFAAPLYIIMVNHGDKDIFHINYENITPADLASWLTALESGLDAEALLEKRIVVLGACYSGSFISQVSKSGRVIITSADENEESYKGPKEDDGIRSGEFFLEEFFKNLSAGYSLRKSFELATDKTENFTKRGGLSANSSSNAYFDSAMQHPVLDDNGDGKGTNAISEASEDGEISSNLYFGTGNNLTNSAASEIKSVADTTYLSDSQSTATVWLTASKNGEVATAWSEIRVPSTTLTSSGKSIQAEIDLPRELLTYNEQIDHWEKSYAGFTEAGRYEIYYYTKDNTVNQEISQMKRSVVYKNKSGNTAPASFDLVSPANSSPQKTVLIFDWSDSSDADGLTYNLVIGTDSNFTTVAYKKEEIADSMTFVDMTSGLSDLTTYYWKVEAVDSYGSVTSSTQTWTFNTNNTNGYPGVVTGMVYSVQDVSKLNTANLTAKLNGVEIPVTVKDGKFVLTASSGTVTITSSAAGYTDAVVADIVVKSGEAATVNVQMNKADTTAPTTTAAPAGGTYSSSQSVTLTASETATIYYTVDGSTPTAASTVYSTAITISANTTLKYFAVDSKGNAESVKTQTYVITTVGSGTGGQADTTAPTTTPAPAGGTYDSAQSVTLTASETSTIYYTVDGSTPTTASAQYSGAISVSTTTTLKFFAVDTAGNPESVKTETYTIVIAEPDTTVPDTTAPVTMVSPGGGSYPSTVAITVELTCEDETDGSGCSAIYYSIDGSSPSSVYSGPIPISATTTLKFYSVDAAGNTESPVNEETYTIVTVAATQASLSVSKSGTGKGTITSLTSKVADGNIDCDADCDATGYVYTKKTKVTLKAEADDDSTFTGWSGGCKGTGVCTVTITKDTAVIANFVAKPLLTVIKAGSGSGTIKGGPSTTCETETGCSVKYNQKVGLTAKADKGSVFLGWSGGGCKGKAKCALTMSADKSVTATFGKPEISVSTESLTFDSLSIKSKVPSKSSFMITNNGDADLKVTKMAITSTVKGDAALFKVTGKAGVIRAGASATVSMSFKPKTAGDKSATLNISSTDPATPVTSITLSGTGTAASASQRGLSPVSDENDPDKLKFNPEGLVSREEAAAFIIAALEGLNEKADGPQSILRSCDDGPSFVDMESTRWSYGYVKTLHELAGDVSKCQPALSAQLSAISYFCPDDLMTKGQLDAIIGAITGPKEENPVQDLSSTLPLTREQMAVAIVQALEGDPAEDYCGTESIFEDIPADHWSCRYIKRLHELIGN